MAARKSIPWGNVKPHAGSVVDRNDPISQGISRCYLFNEGGGTVLTDCAGKSHGEILFDVPRVVGKFGKSLYATGAANNYFKLPLPSIGSTQNWAMSIWVVMGRNDHGYIVLFDTADRQMSIFFDTTVGSFSYYGDMTQGLTAATTGLIYQSLNHFVLTRSGTQLTSYVNGKLKETVTNSGSFSEQFVRFGSNVSSGGSDWIGQYDNVRVYNRALVHTEVLRLFNQPFAGILGNTLRVRSSPPAAAAARSNLTLLGVS